MSDEKIYLRDELCNELGISVHTLQKWYQWERYELSDGTVKQPYLPQPQQMEGLRGSPNYWTAEQLEILKKHKESMVVGRNGRYGKYSNPHHKEEVANG